MKDIILVASKDEAGNTVVTAENDADATIAAEPVATHAGADPNFWSNYGAAWADVGIMTAITIVIAIPIAYLLYRYAKKTGRR